MIVFYWSTSIVFMPAQPLPQLIYHTTPEDTYLGCPHIYLDRISKFHLFLKFGLNIESWTYILSLLCFIIQIFIFKFQILDV